MYLDDVAEGDQPLSVGGEADINHPVVGTGGTVRYQLTVCQNSRHRPDLGGIYVHTCICRPSDVDIHIQYNLSSLPLPPSLPPLPSLPPSIFCKVCQSVQTVCSNSFTLVRKFLHFGKCRKIFTRSGSPLFDIHPHFKRLFLFTTPLDKLAEHILVTISSSALPCTKRTRRERKKTYMCT